MKTNFTGGEELRKISKEEVEEILKSDNEITAYGCGSGSGSGSDNGSGWGIYPEGCGCDDESGSGQSMGLTITNHPYKGIYLSDDIMKNEGLATQITELLASSKTLSNVLAPFKSGLDNLTIRIADGEVGDLMYTDNINMTITINSKYVGKKGFNVYCKGEDENGYLFDGTVPGTFSAAFAHEALHAKHYFWYEESKRYTNTIDESVKFLKDRGFSDDFIKIFYNNTAEGWVDRSADEITKSEHSYFTTYDKEVLDSVRYEYDHRFDPQ